MLDIHTSKMGNSLNLEDSPIVQEISSLIPVRSLLDVPHLRLYIIQYQLSDFESFFGAIVMRILRLQLSLFGMPNLSRTCSSFFKKIIFASSLAVKRQQRLWHCLLHCSNCLSAGVFFAQSGANGKIQLEK